VSGPTTAAGGLQPTCPAVRRPARLLAPGATVHGLRAAGARLSGAHRVVDVFLYGDPPAELGDARRWTLTPSPGGARVRVDAATVAAGRVELLVGGGPDLARYRLDVLPELPPDPPNPPPPALPFDPLRTWLPVRLRPECPDLGSCVEPDPEPPAPGTSPVHDYLARDWAGLRAALVEFLRREDPGADLSPADPQIALLELFAHVADLLHYRLDRVATEAYLETARLRTSVKRHARLVDYEVAEAAAATTSVLLQPAPATPAVQLAAGMVAVDAPGSRLAFSLEADRVVQPALGEIAIYDWGEDACCLPVGATECVLVRPLPADPLGGAWLARGDLLAFEVVDPGGAGRHRDWTRRGVDWPAETAAGPVFRQPLPSRRAAVVTLTETSELADPLAPGLPLLLVRWSPEEALSSAYPVGIDRGAGGAEVTVARANLVPAHHGRLVAGPEVVAAHGAAVGTSPPAGTELAELWLVAAGAPAGGGAGVALRPDGRPHRLEVLVTLPSGDAVVAELVPSLLTVSSPAAFAAVLDIEEEVPPVLRFRTGGVGLAPPAGSQVTARYEVGGGVVGNLPANALRLLERNTTAGDATPSWQIVPGVVARNLVAAAGGRDAATLEVVRRDAPEAFAAEPRRAVLAADYAVAAAAEPGVQRAATRREWSGSWPLMRTAVDLLDDPGGATGLGRLLLALDNVRMLGTEAAVVPAIPAGLLVGLELCALPGVDPAALQQRVLGVLRPGTATRPGLFHPDRMQLGAPVYLSAVLAVVAGLPGVDAVEVREARRLSDPPGTVSSVIRVGPDELAVLDDDPARPERGRLDVRVRGGRA
jgi:hypothetical protein